MPAADVGDERALLELRLHAVECGDPRVDEVRVVARPEEPLAPDVHIGVVLVPAVARAAARGIHDVLGVVDGAEGDLEEAGQERRAVGIRHRERVLGRQRVALGRGVVRDVRTAAWAFSHSRA